ncbi:putative leucine-rich repeat receptor-like serine/threonine-protein kinase At2g24130 isoform X1 [Salvia hispanica]|uniref:putative leucine-rich repeat receptor-like serine/threonine-protein kinase At2g24130 isoform X1 n=1 Tax=Salvia hispanica TaxID=49212 RepID=UPI002009BEB6|nr:putative leucine-rich repeat receptor-like serine/threonine-protein kinase At2g24130 isoform X1 [Salvia hispanica]
MFYKIITLTFSLLQCFVPLLGRGHHPQARYSIHTDKAALLAFKNGMSLDPYSSLANWNEHNDVCNFTLVKCGKLHHRVVDLNLNDNALSGLLSPVLANLTQLRNLSLSRNHFFGSIPQEFSSLRHLQELELGSNNLHGLIPHSLSSLSRLTFITLDHNNLSGEIPSSFFYNCTKLKVVDFSSNQLTGTIPGEIGSCPDLLAVNIYNNKLHGEIPASLGNATCLYNLDVEYNYLSGELPSEMLAKLHKMLYLHLSNNYMISHSNNSDLEPFFTALANCTELAELQLASNGLGGTLPHSIGGLSTYLGELQLQENHIFGSIPPQIGHLQSLTILNLTSNLFTGTVSKEIGKLKHLEQLSLSFNFFTTILTPLGNLSSLGLVDLSHNNLSGRIPEELGNLAGLCFLFLNNNLFSGEIPPSLGSCTALQALDLSYNQLTGNVPPELSGFHEMRRFMNLSHNQLKGAMDLSKLSSVEEIDLSSNYFSGNNIFNMISSCLELKVLNLSNNSLQGHLPESLGDLKSIVAFDVSRNKLSGKIPVSLNKITTLTLLNLAFNNFDGTIPSGGRFDSMTYLSFIGNQDLCGRIPGIPVCKQGRHNFHSHIFVIILCIVIFISGICTIVCCLMGYRRSRATSVRKQELDLTHNYPRITYKELLDATDGFNEQRLVGSGSYGRVYRGILSDHDTQIAVKVLQLQTGNSTKSFARECQVLKSIRHRNLIRIITACSLPDFKALVLPYMVNGSLDSHLYMQAADGLRPDSSDLSLLQRVNICSDIAQGMAYLHHHSPVKVIHCDLKPSNVLLNDDMTALVSDFGIARLVAIGSGNAAGVIENMGDSTANMLSGSIGYIAPEYGCGSSTSTKGDVYSFGVVVLEMVTRKWPTDEMFVGGLSLQSYVKRHFQSEGECVVDTVLLRALWQERDEVKRMWEVAIVELMELGLLCMRESPSTRPTMLDCADDLDRLKTYLNGDTTATFASSHGISSSTYSFD